MVYICMLCVLDILCYEDDVLCMHVGILCMNVGILCMHVGMVCSMIAKCMFSEDILPACMLFYGITVEQNGPEV